MPKWGSHHPSHILLVENGILYQLAKHQQRAFQRVNDQKMLASLHTVNRGLQAVFTIDGSSATTKNIWPFLSVWSQSPESFYSSSPSPFKSHSSLLSWHQIFFFFFFCCMENLLNIISSPS